MKTSSAKAKGRNLQKWAAEKLLKYAPELEPGDVLLTGAAHQPVGASDLADRYRQLLYGVTASINLVDQDYLKQPDSARHAMQRDALPKPYPESLASERP